MDRQPITIAIVDDDLGIRQALERMLNIAGFRVLAFGSGEEFTASVPTTEADCAVIDVDLGTMCGLDLARHPAVIAAKLPLIFVSGSADEAVRGRAIAVGCVEFLRKPFTPIELLDAIGRATLELPIP
ncbi:MAG TPA: response regulator [Steroidobacteraceae bacterium]